MTVLGYFDLIQQNHAIGWALIPEQPTTRVIVEVVDGKSVIATGIANQLHGGLKEKNIGDSYYGFAIPLPTINYLSGRVLRCRAEGSSDYFNGEHLAISPQIVGNVDGISSGIIFGWAVGTPDELPEIEIHQGEKKIACASITLPRADIISQGIATHAYSYYFDLNPFLKTKQAQNKVITLIHRTMDKVLAGSPLSLAETISWGIADKCNGAEIQGWATLSAPHDIKEYALLELWIDDVYVHEILANLPRADFVSMGIKQSRCGFKTNIPGQYLDGVLHTFTLRHKATSEILVNGTQTFTLTLHHSVTYVNGSIINGWAFIEQTPLTHNIIEAWENGRCIASTKANQSYPATPIKLQKKFGVSSTGFTIELPKPIDSDQPRRIRLTLEGTTQSIAGNDILIGSRAEFIRQAECAAQLDSSFRWWVRDWIIQLRANETQDGSLYKEIPSLDSASISQVIDIIIPVYKGLKETLACLHSLLDCGDIWHHEIIVINDASPDEQLILELRTLAQEKPITLLENSNNLGFVATVNRGMRLHPDRDVILLNADTLLPAADWISRLRSAAYSNQNIATVTPFSNRATICSLPIPQFDNDLPDGLTVSDLDQLCAKSNDGIYVDIPTAIGFCMFIKRQALNEVGLFDEERWAKGYCEENDFCLRASTLGWKHIAACDIFVQHHGSVSFQSEKQVRVEKNLARLNAMYPEYPETISRFIRHDPLSVPRSHVVLQLMKQTAKRHILHITHAWGGGIKHHVDQLCRKPTKKGQSALILSPTNDGRIEIIQPDSDLVLSLPVNALANLSDSDAPLINYLQQLGVTAIHLHHWIGLPATVWELAKALGVPFDYTVHDYYTTCPRIHFIDYTGQFCEQAPLSRCELCVKAKPLESPEIEKAFTELGGTVAAWRNFHQDHLYTARSIIAPCQDAANRIQQSFALKQVTVKAHDNAVIHFKPKPLPTSGQPLRVAVIGAIGPNKGYDQLLALAQFAEQQAPQIRFFIVGYTMDDAPFETLTNVQITGKYAQEQLQSLLAALDCHVALFLSPWPETYSYTLSEALCAGLTPVVPILGALGERISGIAGRVYKNILSPSYLVNVLLNLKILLAKSQNHRITKH